MSKQRILSEEVLKAFAFQPNANYRPFGAGHINDTFLVESPEKTQILQRINKSVFPSPENIMDNISSVTAFIAEKVLERGGNPDREVLQVIQTADGKLYHIDQSGDYWRCIKFIDNTEAYETVTDSGMLAKAGYAFGDFQNLLTDFPAQNLHEIIRDFHNTPVRFAQLQQAASENRAGRLHLVQKEMEFAGGREADCRYLTDLLASGKLPLKVTHNDTKMSNVLIDKDTSEAVCIIDLDTVMPGLAAYDFGDSIRAGATTAAEDETNLDNVRFSIPLYQAYTEGFLRAAGSSLTENEIHTLPMGAKLMTLEVGMRFLADYLNGDVYFKTAYENHNLDRARNQFKLVTEMEKSMDEMLCIIKNTISGGAK